VSRRLGIALVAITLATAACDLLAVPDVIAPMGVGDFAIVTQPAPPPGTPQPCMAALLEGTLEGDRERGLAVRIDGHGLVIVAWPFGFRGNMGPPVALLDAHRAVVATVGEPISLGGGFVGGRFIACPFDVGAGSVRLSVTG
jgi:hypothetical protein